MALSAGTRWSSEWAVFGNLTSDFDYELIIVASSGSCEVVYGPTSDAELGLHPQLLKIIDYQLKNIVIR